MDLAAIERCYDAIPRQRGTVEEVGPFSLFVADPATGWSFYARPTLGVGDIGPDDVRRLLARQRELGVPQTIEWVDDVTPSLRAAVAEAVPDAEPQVVPLLVAAAADVAPPEPGRTRVLGPEDPDLTLALGVVHAGFSDLDQAMSRDLGNRASMIRRGDLVDVAGYAEDGRLVGGGSAAPRGEAAELMGIATLTSARGQGVGTAVTRALVAAVRELGVATVFLTAASDAASSVYRGAGFERVATAIILDAGS